MGCKSFRNSEKNSFWLGLIFVLAVPAYAKAPAIASMDSCAALISPQETDLIVGRYLTIESRLKKISEDILYFPEQIGIPTELGESLAAIPGVVTAAFESWDGRNSTSQVLIEALRAAENILGKAERIMAAAHNRIELANQQKQATFQQVRENPDLLLPNRLYVVQTDRGDKISVRFSRDLIESFFHKTKYSAAGAAALEAIGRGIQTRGKIAGIANLFEYHGYRFTKIHLKGPDGMGAIRVYGFDEGNGKFSFVHYEHEGDHDSAFLQVAARASFKKFQRETWQ